MQGGPGCAWTCRWLSSLIVIIPDYHVVHFFDQFGVLAEESTVIEAFEVFHEGVQVFLELIDLHLLYFYVLEVICNCILHL